MPRLYVPHTLLLGAFTLPEATFRHAVQVLRLSVGDSVILFNGDGLDYPATLVELHKRHAVVEVGLGEPVTKESPLTLHLALAISKGDRMDLALQKATELGVSRISPLISERTVVRLDADRLEKKSEHWQGIVVSACEQSGRAVVPIVEAPKSLATWLGQKPQGLLLVLAPNGRVRLRSLSAPTGTVTVLIGPEGGLSEEELGLAEQQGFQRLALGPRILRTETAPLAILAALQAQWGDF